MALNDKGSEHSLKIYRTSANVTLTSLAAWGFVTSVLFRDVLKIGNVSVYHVVAASTFFVLLLPTLSTGRVPKNQLRADVVFLLVILWLVLSPMWAGLPNDYGLFLGWIGFGYMTWFISRKFFLSSHRTTYLRVISVLFIYLLLFALVESFTSYHLPSSRIRALGLHHLHNVPTATFWNQNDFAFYLVLFFGIATSFVRSNLIRVGILSAVTYVLFLINSTAAWIGFIAFLVAYLYIQRKYRILIYASCVLLIILVSGVILELEQLGYHMERIHGYLELSGSADPESSVSIRVNLIKEGWSAFAKTGGLGLGPGGVRDVLREAGSEIVTLHNLPLEILFNGGVPVLVGILFVYFRAIWLLFHRTRNARGDRIKRLYGAIWASLVSLPFAAIGPAFTPYISSFWVWLGLVSGVCSGVATTDLANRGHCHLANLGDQSV